MADCWRLKSYDQSPPGGFPFQDESGKQFPAQPLIEAQAQIVMRYRQDNGKPRATILECIQDVDHYTCQRLGHLKTFCIPCNGNAKVALSQSAPAVAPPCHGCGAPVTG